MGAPDGFPSLDRSPDIATQHRAAEPERLHRRLQRWLPFSWFVAHGLATAGALVLVIGGIVGQQCPPIVGIVGKSGPFAYDDGDLTEALSLLFTGPATLAVGAGLFAAAVALGEAARTRRGGRTRALIAVVAVANVLAAAYLLLIGVGIGAGQAHEAIYCDPGAVVGHTAWIGASATGALGLAWLARRMN